MKGSILNSPIMDKINKYTYFLGQNPQLGFTPPWQTQPELKNRAPFPQNPPIGGNPKLQSQLDFRNMPSYGTYGNYGPVKPWKGKDYLE